MKRKKGYFSKYKYEIRGTEVKVTTQSQKTYLRKLTKIEQWCAKRNVAIEEIMRVLELNNSEYNKAMQDPQSLTVKKLKKLIKLTDHTLEDIVYSTIEDTDLKELSQSEIRYVMAIRKSKK